MPGDFSFEGTWKVTSAELGPLRSWGWPAHIRLTLENSFGKSVTVGVRLDYIEHPDGRTHYVE